MLSKEISTMNVFAGINSIDDYEAIKITYGKLADSCIENYESTQLVYKKDAFGEIEKGIIKYNYKGVVFKEGNSWSESCFDLFRYLEYNDLSPNGQALFFDNETLTFSDINDKKQLIEFIEQYNTNIKRYIELGIKKHYSEFERLINSNELKTYAINLISMLPKQLLTNITLHDMLIYYLNFLDDITKEYIGFQKDDVIRNQSILRDNSQLQEPMGNVFSILRKYHGIIKDNYDIPNSYINFFAYLNINSALNDIYINSWESENSFFKPNDIYLDAFNDYIIKCCEEHLISMENEASIIASAYYCRKTFSLSPTYITAIINKIQKIISDYNKALNDQLFINKIMNGTKTVNNSSYSIDDIDLMTGSEFEEFIAKLFIKMGYSAYTTKTSGDQGIDVIAEKNGIKYGIQAKCYSNSVGNSAVQEAVAGKSFYGCDKIIVITNNSYTKSAIELATANGVILWDRNILKEKLVYINQ